MRWLIGLVLFWVSMVPAQAAWREATTKHFRFYSEGNEKAFSDFATKVERFDAFLRRKYQISQDDQSPRLTVYMLDTATAVGKAYGAGGRNVAGFYHGDAAGSFAVVHRSNRGGKFALDADSVLFHEYSHHFMLHYFPAAFPVWFVEGYAEFNATTDFDSAGRATYGRPPYYRAYGILVERPIPVETLVVSTGGEFRPEMVDAFYGRSWLLTHFLTMEDSRAGQLAAYIVAVTKGSDNLAAAKAAFGDLAVLDKQLAKYVTRISSRQTNDPVPYPSQLDIRQLSEVESALVPLQLALAQHPGEDELPRLIARLRAVSAAHPASAEAHHLLGEAEFLAKNDTAAEAAADAVIAINPKLSRALLLKGQIMQRRYIRGVTNPGDFAKAMRGWIVKANRADVTDPMPLIAYFDSYRTQGIEPPAVAFDGLRRAFEMVPEDESVRMMYANSLAAQKKYADAVRVVETVAFDPHPNANTKRALAILERLKAARDGKQPFVGDLDVADIVNPTGGKSDE